MIIFYEPVYAGKVDKPVFGPNKGYTDYTFKSFFNGNIRNAQGNSPTWRINLSSRKTKSLVKPPKGY